MSQDFSKGKIYKITNDYNNDIYVGSTCDTLVKRFNNHKRHSREPRRLEYPLYKLMNKIGFERFRIELICNYPCEDKYQLRQKEGKHIREIGTLNISIAGGVDEQEYQKEYRENNKEYFKEYFTKYYNENKDRYKKEKPIVKCKCGCEITQLSQHLKSKKHEALMKSLTIKD